MANRLKIQKFLNQKGLHSFGAILVDVKYKGGLEPSCSGTLEISDCARSICLDISLSGGVDIGREEIIERENTIKKLKILYSSIGKLLEFVEDSKQKMITIENNE